MYSWSSQEYSSVSMRRIWRNLEDRRGFQAPVYAIGDAHLQYSRVFMDADLSYSAVSRKVFLQTVKSLRDNVECCCG